MSFQTHAAWRDVCQGQNNLVQLLKQLEPTLEKLRVAMAEVIGRLVRVMSDNAKLERYVEDMAAWTERDVQSLNGEEMTGPVDDLCDPELDPLDLTIPEYLEACAPSRCRRAVALAAAGVRPRDRNWPNLRWLLLDFERQGHWGTLKGLPGVGPATRAWLVPRLRRFYADQKPKPKPRRKKL